MPTSLFSDLSAATESGNFFASAISKERKDFLATTAAEFQQSDREDSQRGSNSSSWYCAWY